MRLRNVIKCTLIIAGTTIGIAAHDPAHAAGNDSTVPFGSWTFFSRPDPQTKKTEYTVYNKAKGEENVGFMLTCSDKTLNVYLFDGVPHKPSEKYKLTFTFDDKTKKVLSGAGSNGDPIIFMMPEDDTILHAIASAKAFAITTSGAGKPKTYRFDNAKASDALLLFSENCQET